MARICRRIETVEHQTSGGKVVSAIASPSFQACSHSACSIPRTMWGGVTRWQRREHRRRREGRLLHAMRRRRGMQTRRASTGNYVGRIPNRAATVELGSTAACAGLLARVRGVIVKHVAFRQQSAGTAGYSSGGSAPGASVVRCRCPIRGSVRVKLAGVRPRAASDAVKMGGCPFCR